jgi:putative Mn2+ efflux pump MntP
VAFAILLAIGLKMIYEAAFENESTEEDYYTRWTVIVLLSIATSIGALAVGIGIGLLESDILIPALVIGLTSFSFRSPGSNSGRIWHGVSVWSWR